MTDMSEIAHLIVSIPRDAKGYSDCPELRHAQHIRRDPPLAVSRKTARVARRRRVPVAALSIPDAFRHVICYLHRASDGEEDVYIPQLGDSVVVVLLADRNSDGLDGGLRPSPERYH